MKTITEFSGIVLRRAAEAQRTFRADHPQEPKAEPALGVGPPAEDSASVVEPAEGASESAASDAAASLADGAAEVAPAEDATPAEPSAAESAPADAAPPEPVDLGTGPEAEAVGAALQVQGDRLSRLMEALDVVGRRAAQVRLVRVVQGDPAPAGAQKRGEFLYLVDLMPRPQAVQRESADGRDGRRGGPGRDRDGGRGRGPGGPRGAGGPGGGRGPGGPGGPGGGGGRGPGGSGGPGGSRSPAGAHGSKFTGDRAPRDEGRETPRGGAGWTLSRPQNDRVYADDANPARGARPPRDPRFDQRGPRPPQGDRPPRGPRPEGAAGGAPQGDGRRDHRGPDRGGPRPANAAGRPGGGGPSNGRRGPGPGLRRPEGDRPQPPRGDRHWGGFRRGGWDEPAVPDTAQNLATAVAEPVAPQAPESAPLPPPAVPTENAGPPPTNTES